MTAEGWIVAAILVVSVLDYVETRRQTTALRLFFEQRRKWYESRGRKVAGFTKPDLGGSLGGEIKHGDSDKPPKLV